VEPYRRSTIGAEPWKSTMSKYSPGIGGMYFSSPASVAALVVTAAVVPVAAAPPVAAAVPVAAPDPVVPPASSRSA